MFNKLAVRLFLILSATVFLFLNISFFSVAGETDNDTDVVNANAYVYTYGNNAAKLYFPLLADVDEEIYLKNSSDTSNTIFEFEKDDDLFILHGSSRNRAKFYQVLDNGAASWQYSLDGSHNWTNFVLLRYQSPNLTLSYSDDSANQNAKFTFSISNPESAYSLELIDFDTLRVRRNGSSISFTPNRAGKFFTISRSLLVAGYNAINVTCKDVFNNDLNINSNGGNVAFSIIPNLAVSNLPSTNCAGPDFRLSFTSDVAINSNVKVYFHDENNCGDDITLDLDESANFSCDESRKTFSIEGMSEQRYENMKYSLVIYFDVINDYGSISTYRYSLKNDRSIVFLNGTEPQDPMIITFARNTVFDSFSIKNSSRDASYVLDGDEVKFTIVLNGNYADNLRELNLWTEYSTCSFNNDSNDGKVSDSNFSYNEETDKSTFEYTFKVENINSMRALDYEVVIVPNTQENTIYTYNRHTGIANNLTLVPKLNPSVSSYSAAGKRYLNSSDNLVVSFSGIYSGGSIKLQGIVTEDGLAEIPSGIWSSSSITLPISSVSSYLTHNQPISLKLRVIDSYGQTKDVEINTAGVCSYYSNFTAASINITQVLVGNKKSEYYKDKDTITVKCEADREMRSVFSDRINITNVSIDRTTFEFSFQSTDTGIPEQMILKLFDASNSQIFLEVNNATLNLTFLPDIEVTGTPSFVNNRGDYLLKDSEIGFDLKANHDVQFTDIKLYYTTESEGDYSKYVNIELDEPEYSEKLSANIALAALDKDILKNDALRFKFAYTIIDQAGHDKADTVEVPQLYIKSLIDSVSDVKWTTSTGKNYVKPGDTVTISFKSSHPLNPDSFAIKGFIGDEDFTEGKSKGRELMITDKGEWKKVEASFVIPENYELKDNSELFYTIKITQTVNGEQIDSLVLNNGENQNSIFYYAPIKAQNIVFESDSKGNEAGYVKDENTLTLSFDTTHRIAISQATIGDKSINGFTETKSNGSFNYTAKVKVDELNLDDNKTFDFKVELGDDAGNNSVVLTGKDVKNTNKSFQYHAPINLNDGSLNISIINRDNITYAINGDVIVIKFETKHPVKIDKATIAGKPISFTSDEEGKNWTGTYTVKNGDFADTAKLPIKITLSDKGGNKPVTLNNKNIQYYAPISANDLSFTTSNGSKTGLYANNTDTLTLSFKSTHELTISNIRIADIGIPSFTCKVIKGVYNYSVSVPVSDLKIVDNTDITYSFELTDEAKNSPVKIDNSKTAAIRYYAQIDPSFVLVVSDNSQDTSKYAINGNTITVSFNTSHPVSIKSAKVSNYPLSLYANDGMNWTGTFKVPDSIVADTTNIPISILLMDEASNTEKQIDKNDLQYFRPLTVSSAVIHTDNAKDQSKYVADGNRVTVDVVTNHQIDMSASSFYLLGQRFDSVTETQVENGYRYSYSKVMQHGEIADLSTVPFSFSVTDIARSATVARDQNSEDVTNRITYYMPLTVTSSISSNNQYPAFAKNGSSITVSSTLNHAANATGAILNDRSMNISGNDSAGITFSYQIAADEQNLAEGELSVAVSYEDVAGNTLTMTSVNEGTVTYDRTTPVIEVGNAFSGFTANDVVFDIAITDAHIDTGVTKVSVNNETRTIGNGIDSNGIRYTTSIANDKEGTYTIKIEAADLAGNVADPVVYTVTVDKTNPELTKTSVLSDKNRIFKQGVKVSDLVEIKDNNAVEVMCTIYENNEYVEWDIDEPIMTDGTKHITITAKDKAGNPGNALDFTIYIDGTCPEPVIKNATDGKVFEDGMSFSDKVTMNFSLRDLSYDETKPDFFTVLQIIKPDGTTVDLLKSGSDGNYSYEFADPGTYTIVIKANDSIGNETEEIKYTLTIEEQFIDVIKDFFTGSDNNASDTDDDSSDPSTPNKAKLIAIGGGAGLGVIILVVGGILIVKKSRKGIR